MKGKMRSLKVVIGALLAIVLGTACFVGAGAVLLLFSGPFSDAQSSPTIYSPIDNITISDRGRYRLRWEVDDRFSVEFGNGFVIIASCLSN